MTPSLPHQPRAAISPADFPQTTAVKALERQSRAVPKGEDTQGLILEQINWLATTNRALPSALKQEVARARSSS